MIIHWRPFIVAVAAAEFYAAVVVASLMQTEAVIWTRLSSSMPWSP
jgi:hypothetical protein